MKTTITVLALVLLPAGAHAFHCTVCHSKNPAMVKMHKAVEGRNCFDCHHVGDKLMGKGQPKDPEALRKRRTTEEVCRECHKD